MSSEINIRSNGYLVARATGTCWHCGAATRLLALALPPGHENLAMDADADAMRMRMRMPRAGCWLQRFGMPLSATRFFFMSRIYRMPFSVG